uniref:Uncharacterized protein n=1 Tax=Bionectria ochroleuca TaxID=29856 RepID=A0A8H7NCL4_BIOOC
MSLHPALSFGASQPPRPLLLQPSLLASPPASPPARSSSDSFAGNVLNSCLSLQSLMTAPTGTASDQLPHTWDQLPTPPLPHANLPLKLRLRRPANVDKTNSAPATPRRIVKRGTASRRLQKRRRCPQTQDHIGRDDSDALDSETSDLELDPESSSPTTPTLAPKELSAPATPKRARIAPEQLPLGLERADFTKPTSGIPTGVWTSRSQALTWRLRQTGSCGAPKTLAFSSRSFSPCARTNCRSVSGRRSGRFSAGTTTAPVFASRV